MCTLLLGSAVPFAQAAEVGPPVLELAVSDSSVAVHEADGDVVPSTQTMLSARLQRVRLGVGLEQPVTEGRAGRPGDAQSSQVMLGLSVDVGARSRLSWQAQWPPSRAAESADSAESRSAWKLTKRDPMAALRAGSLFKVQLSEQTVVTLRPRRGQAVLTVQHRW